MNLTNMLEIELILASIDLSQEAVRPPILSDFERSVVHHKFDFKHICQIHRTPKEKFLSKRTGEPLSDDGR